MSPRSKSKSSPKRPASAPSAVRHPEQHRSVVLEFAAAGHGPTACAALASKKLRLRPPMSHRTASRIIAASRAGAPPPVVGPVDPELLDAPLETLLRDSTVALISAGKRFAQAGNSQAYLRALGALPSLISLGDRLASRRAPQDKPFDGLAGLLVNSLRADEARRKKDPAEWLLDAAARLRGDLCEACSAIANLDLPPAKTAELVRPLVLGAEAILAAVAAVAGARP